MLLGHDILHIPRLTATAERFGMRFFEKLLTPQEIDDCLRRTPHLPLSDNKVLARLAARIAVKEATAKALKVGLNGLGWGKGVNWHDIRVASPEKQAPYLELTKTALQTASILGIQHWAISWSHDGDYASATVIGH